MDSGGSAERGGIELDVGCPNAEECWPPPKTDKVEAAPKTEPVAKGLGVDTSTENAFWGGTEFRSRSGVIPNGEGFDPPKPEEACGGMGAGVLNAGSSP